MQSRQAPLTTSLLRRLQHRRYRDQFALCFVEGVRMVAAAAQSGAPLEALVTCAPLMTSPRARDLAARLLRRGIPRLEVPVETFRALSRRDGPQGIGAVVRQRWELLDHIVLSSGATWVALHAVGNPGNLGMILRTCDAVGCDGVMLLDRTADPHDPAALKASTGAAFSQRLVRAEFREFAAWARRMRCMVVGTSPSVATDYRAVANRAPLVLLMGSEQHGLSHDQQALCDAVVTIPMRGRGDSLNLAVATSIVLYETVRQQRPAGEARGPPLAALLRTRAS